MMREYAPYAKWFGKAFKKLPLASQLTSNFDAILNSQDWKTREDNLSEVYLLMQNAHNSLGVTPPIPVEISPFHDRPFLVPNSSRFVEGLLHEITDPDVASLPKHLGNINQISDNTDVLEDPQRCRALIKALLK
jgi:hypothetical protein